MEKSEMVISIFASEEVARAIKEHLDKLWIGKFSKADAVSLAGWIELADGITLEEVDEDGEEQL